MPTGSWSEAEIERRAVGISQALRGVAEVARNEAELRIGTVQTLRDFAREAGLDLEDRHEYALGHGRADSVYGRVLIEFMLGDFLKHAVLKGIPLPRRILAQALVVRGIALDLSPWQRRHLPALERRSKAMVLGIVGEAGGYSSRRGRVPPDNPSANPLIASSKGRKCVTLPAKRTV